MCVALNMMDADDLHGAPGVIYEHDDEVFGESPPPDGPDDSPYHADDPVFLQPPPSDGPAFFPHAADDNVFPHDAAGDNNVFVEAPPPPDNPAWTLRDANDAILLRAPPPDGRHLPDSYQQVDAIPFRQTIQTWVEEQRAAAGLPALSADMARRRRALDHRSMALEFVQRRRARVAVGLEQDELCRKVLHAMDAQVIGSCAYCGCNFYVVATLDVGELGKVCGSCGRMLRVYNPVPMVRNLPADADERFKGWVPW